MQKQASHLVRWSTCWRMCQRLLLGVSLAAIANLAYCQTQEPAAGDGWFRIKAENLNCRSHIDVSGAGDVNGDGIDDVIVGSFYSHAGRARPQCDQRVGLAYVIYGRTNGFTHINLDTLQPEEGFKIRVDDVANSSGRFNNNWVSGIGDVNGDGIDDVIIGGRWKRNRSNETYIIFGKNEVRSDIDVGQLSFDDGFRVYGTDEDYKITVVSGIGDMNGDGLNDLIVGGEYIRRVRGGPVIYVIYGKNNRLNDINLDVLTPDVGFIMQNTNSISDLNSASGAGDVNGDGFDDLIIGVHYWRGRYRDNVITSRSQAAYLIYGSNARLNNIHLEAIASTDGFKMEGREHTWRVSDFMFSSMPADGAGDVNGDGIDDLIIGDGGITVYVMYGGAARSGTVALPELSVDEGFTIDTRSALSSRSYYPRRISGAGDINGDGLDDFIVAGASDGAFVIFGKRHRTGNFFYLANMEPEDRLEIRGGGNEDRFFGDSMSSAGDINGDGIDDLIVGVSCDGLISLTTDNAEAYVIFGRKEVPFGPEITVHPAGPDHCQTQ